MLVELFEANYLRMDRTKIGFDWIGLQFSDVFYLVQHESRLKLKIARQD